MRRNARVDRAKGMISSAGLEATSVFPLPGDVTASMTATVCHH